MVHLQQRLDISERRACGPLASRARPSASRTGCATTDPAVDTAIISWPVPMAAMAIAASPRCCAPQASGLIANGSLRIWQREGLKVPAKQAKRGRLWLNIELCCRLRPSTLTTCESLRFRGRPHSRWETAQNAHGN